jgi:hypothetical protein
MLIAAQMSTRASAQIIFAREYGLAITMVIAPYDLRSEPLASTGLVWRGRVLHNSAVVSLRVHVIVTGPSAGWRLRIRSEDTGTLVETYTPSATTMAVEGFWTRDIPGRAAFVDLELTAPGTPPQVIVDRYAYDTRPSTQQAIHGIDGRLKIVEASAPIRAHGGYVGRLRIIIEGMGQATCTGFLVTPALLFTNEHCVSSPTEARSTLVDLGYDQPDRPTETLRTTELVVVNHDLDYALLRLERPAPAQFSSALMSGSTLSTNQQLLIVEHPLGGYKQVSLESCEVSDLEMSGVTSALTDFGHRCDTLNGSSGSPVIDLASGRVVGLHHFGFDLQANTLVNRAVLMKLVLADVKRQRPDLPLPY